MSSTDPSLPRYQQSGAQFFNWGMFWLVLMVVSDLFLSVRGYSGASQSLAITGI